MDLLNKTIVRLMPIVPKMIVGKVASRYIAGTSLEDAVAEVRQLNGAGVSATMDLLGEHSDIRSDAISAAEEYIKILDAIKQENIDSNISLKPTQLGLRIDKSFCLEQIRAIVQHASDLGNFVRIDMEDHTCTDDTLDMYYSLRKDYENVGVVIQAYLRRTMRDIEGLKEVKANIRLCKGIYNEPRTIAFKIRENIIRNFSFALEELFKAGCYVGIATHCEETVWYASRILQRLGLNRDQYEFQMLLGVDPELRKIITDEGHKMRIYVPYGDEWYAYSTRRLKEKPNLAGSVFKEFLGLPK